MTTNIVFIEASQPQHVPAGNLLGKMYYSGFLRSVLVRDEYMGYPHNGGEHSLMLKIAPKDLQSFFALIREAFPSHEGVSEFIESVTANFKKKYPTMQSA